MSWCSSGHTTLRSSRVALTGLAKMGRQMCLRRWKRTVQVFGNRLTEQLQEQLYYFNNLLNKTFHWHQVRSSITFFDIHYCSYSVTSTVRCSAEAAYFFASSIPCKFHSWHFPRPSHYWYFVLLLQFCSSSGSATTQYNINTLNSYMRHADVSSVVLSYQSLRIRLTGWRLLQLIR